MLAKISLQLETTRVAQVMRLEKQEGDAKVRHEQEETRLKQEEGRLYLQRDHADREESVLSSEIIITETTIKYVYLKLLKHILFCGYYDVIFICICILESGPRLNKMQRLLLPFE